MDQIGLDLNDMLMSSLGVRPGQNTSNNNSNVNSGTNSNVNSNLNDNNGATNANSNSVPTITSSSQNASSTNTNSGQQARSSNPYFSNLFNNLLGIGNSAFGFATQSSGRNSTRNQSSSTTPSLNSRNDQSNRQQSQQQPQQQQQSSTNQNSNTDSTANGQLRRRITWAEYANLLDNVRQTQERFMPHFEAFQRSLLEPHGTYNYQQSEELQTRFRMTSRVMHHLAHVYHMLSDFHISYLHQQDHNVQIYHPIAPSPLHLRPAATEVRMNLSSNSGSSSNLNDLLNNNATASNDISASRPEEGLSSNSSTVSRRDLSTSRFIPVASIVTTSGFLPTSQLQATDSTNDNNSNNSQERSMEQELQNLLRSGLPNLTSNSSAILAPSTIVIQAVSSTGSNRNLNQSSNNDNTNNNNNDNQRQPINLSNFFNFGSNRSQSNQQNASQTAPNTTTTTNSTSNQNTTSSNQNNSTSNQTSSNQQSRSSSGQQSSMPGLRDFTTQRIRMPATGRTGLSPATLPYQSHILNFDPHLPCTSTYLIPEMQARLEVDYQSIPTTIPLNIDSNSQTAGATANTRTNRTRLNASQLREMNERRRSVNDLTRQTAQPASDVEALELFNDLRSLFSTYFEHDELIRRIDNLPRLANDSLKSFIDSMNILNLVSRDNSNITLELFMILAQKISVVEFLKILFMQDNESSLKCLKCLNRAQNSMVDYARTNLLFNNEEPFDTSGCVDELLKVWKKILSASFVSLSKKLLK